MYLAEIQQGGVNVIHESMEMQAIPGHTTVDGLIYFNTTEAVSNDKGLLVRYQPSDSLFIGDTIFEFKVNDFKRIDSESKDEVSSDDPESEEKNSYF